MEENTTPVADNVPVNKITVTQKVEGLEAKARETKEKLVVDDVEEVVREIARLESISQQSQLIGRVAKVCVATKKDLSSIVSHEQLIVRAATAKAETGAPWEDGGRMLPDGYEMELGGVVRKGKIAEVITTSPLWVNSLVRNLTENRTEFELAWIPQHRHSTLKKLIVQKSIAGQPRELLKLLDNDVPLKQSTAGRVADYLMEYASHNAGALEASVKYLVRRPGWVELDDEMTVFAAYSDRVVFQPDPKMAVAETHLSARGTYEAWVTGIRPMVEKSPMLAFFMAAALAAPLLEPLRIPGFVVDQYGRTSTGKTTTLRTVASIFGKAGGNEGNGLVAPWNATPTYVEEILKFYSHMPVFCMDSQDLRPEAIERIAYMVGNGAGKGRGAKEGGTRERAEFKAVLLSDGEAAMYDRLDQGGAKARVLSIQGSGITDLDASDIDVLNALIHENHGVLGPRYLSKVVEMQNDLSRIYSFYRNQMAVKAKTSVEKRMSGYFAVIATAAKIANALPGFEWFLGVVEAATALAWTRATTAYQEEARSQKALQSVADWVAMNRSHFAVSASDPEDIAPCYGRISEPSGSADGYVAAFWSELSKMLGLAGFKGAEALRREWIEDGVLAHKKGATTHQVRISGVKQNLLVFQWDRLFPVDAEERKKKTEATKTAEVMSPPLAGDEDKVSASDVTVIEVGDTYVRLLEAGHDCDGIWGLTRGSADVIRKALTEKKTAGIPAQVGWVKPVGDYQRYITHVL